MSEVTKTGTDATLTCTTDNRGFLGDLTHPTCPILKYAYQGKEQFLKFYQHALNTIQPCSEWLLLTKVTNEIFHAECLESEEHPFSNVSSIVSKPHEATPAWSKLRAYGGYHSAADWGKIPDEAWRPLRLPKGRSLDWPSVVLEASFSETRKKLMSDIRHWLGASGGDVKVVFTVAIERHAPKIITERWVMKNSREGREQRIEIAKSGAEVAVSKDALELSFERIFLCPPSTDGETIISVHAPALKSFAEAIWEQQGFIGVQRIQ
ncbi:hypothetical protein BDW68DRAFT_187689 [Aspergillus falconensis]